MINVYPRKHPDKRLSLFNDPLQRQRYACSLVMILLMIGVAEILQEKEIIFPEMAALTIGMWIVDKRVIVKTCSDSLFSIGQKNCQLFVAKLRNFLDSHNRMVLY